LQVYLTPIWNNFCHETLFCFIAFHTKGPLFKQIYVNYRSSAVVWSWGHKEHHLEENEPEPYHDEAVQLNTFTVSEIVLNINHKSSVAEPDHFYKASADKQYSFGSYGPGADISVIDR
jgi:hypothetical protein